MKVSIIGCGKMGKEIIELFLDSEVEIVWIGRNKLNEEKNTQFLTKKISRIGRKNNWNIQQINKRNEDVKTSFDLAEIYGSDYVIETITEDLKSKQELFDSIQNIVDDDCILLTNTSSIPLKRIYSKIKKKNRCAGLHFFYPCKVINTVEVNQFQETDELCICKIKDLLSFINMNSIVLQENVNMFFSKLILILMTEAYNIYCENKISADEIDELVKKKLMMMGIFEILNSTGNKIVYNTVNFFCDSDNENFFQKFKNVINEIHKKYNDCSFDTYLVNNKQIIGTVDFTEKEKYLQYIILRLKCVYINYITYAVTVCKINKFELIAASKDILGIMSEPKEIIDEIGEKNIVSVLKNSLEKCNCRMYQKNDYSIWR